MLQAMWEEADGAASRERLATHRTTDELRRWVDSWEDRPVDVATRLVKTWGRRPG